MNVEGVKKLVRALNWPKLKAHLQETPLTGGDVDNLLEVVYHSDSMVRRRPNDDGTGRNKFLDALATHLGDAGHSDAVEVIGHSGGVSRWVQQCGNGGVAALAGARALSTDECVADQIMHELVVLLVEARRSDQA